MNGKRKYDSSGRRAEAKRTRGHIIDVAATLFETCGYSGTTVRRVAEQAGVSPETVYAAFGSKAVLLARAIDERVGGEGGQRPLLQQQWVRRLVQQTSLELRLEELVEHGASVTARVAPLLVAARSAALSDPDIAQLLTELERARDQDLTQLFDLLVADEPLRPDVDRAEAITWFAALTGDQVFLDLVQRRGWPLERYRAWVRATIRRTLFPS